MKPNPYYYTLLILCLLLPIRSIADEGDMYKVPLNNKVQNSQFIFTGEVVSQESKWNEDNSLIVTISKVRVSKIFKGEVVADTIEIETVGGQVGFQKLETSSLLSLEMNDYGMFFCNEENSGEPLKVYSSKQGFLKYVGGRAVAPFEDADIQDIEATIELMLGTTPVEKVAFTPTITNAFSNPNITFSPSTVTSGTNTLLTIEGSGFGTTGPDATNYIAFANADDGGAPSYISPAAYSYVSWTDTMIVVNVPTPAGTGPIQVTLNGTDDFSADTLEVQYAILNTGEDIIPVLNDLNGQGGQTWTYGSGMSSSYEQAFERAYDNWRCATGVNWLISSSSVSISSANGNDGINVVARGSTSVGVLGVCYNFYSSCNGGLNWRVIAQDIIFKNTTSWNTSTSPPNSWQVDFESVALHELGHAHLLGHVVHNDAMYFSIGNGIMSRVLGFYNIAAGLEVMSLSTQSGPCITGPMVQDYPNGCTPLALTDVGIYGATPGLVDGTCFGSSPVVIDFTNFGLDTAFQIDFGWSINGVQQPSVTWNSVLAANDTVSNYLLDNYNFQDSSYTVSIWIDSVNGQAELNNSNDTTHYIFDTDPCVPNNAAITNFVELDSTICLSNESIVVDLVNAGTNTLNSCWLYYSANGLVQDSVLWTGSLAPTDTAFGVVIATHNSFFPSVDFTILAESPNGVPDEYNPNDTLFGSVTPQVMVGTYTIGGSQPDFQTIEEAAYRLNTYGICGDVDLLIRSGTYTGSLLLDSIPTNDPNNIITITSEANHQDSVHINAIVNAQHIILLDSTDNVVIKNLSLHFDDGTYYGELIYVGAGCNNIFFDSLYLDMSDPDYAQNETGKKGVHIQGNTTAGNRLTNDITFRNGRIEYGQHAFDLLNGSPISSGVYPTNWLIENNEILYTGWESVEVYGVSNLKIIGNYFESDNYYNNGSSSYSQLVFDQTQDSILIKDNIFVYSGYRNCMHFKDCENTMSAPVLLYNNSINYTQTSAENVILFHDSGNAKFFNNTIQSETSGTFSSDGINLQVESSDSVVVMNNHLINNNSSGLLRISNTGFTADHNNYFTTGGNVFTYAGSNFNGNLAAHQASSGQDANSYSIDPNLYNGTHLFPTNLAVNDLGTPLPEIQTDLPGNLRDPVTPDIGAYEFDQYNYDLSAEGSLSSNATVCPGSNQLLHLTVKNVGVQTIDSFQVYVNVNNTIYDTVWIQQVITPGTTVNSTIGTYLMAQQFGNSIEMTIAMPNNIPDQLPLNNTFSFSVYTRLNGVYTLGDAGSDFPLLNDAFTYLNQWGVCGPVTFNINDGNYTGANYNQINLIPFFGMSDVNTLTIQSTSLDSTLVNFNSTDPTFYLNGAKHIRFRHLGFEPLNINDFVFNFESTEDIEISNCFFDAAMIESDYPMQVSNIYIENNHFSFSSRIQMEANGTIDSIFIRNNEFTGNSRIFLEGFANIFIEENDFFSNLSYNTHGVDIGNCDGFLINKNDFQSVKNAIYIHDCIGTYGGAKYVTNNFIRSIQNGLNLNGSDDVHVANNSFYQFLNQFSTAFNPPVSWFGGNTNSNFYNNIVQTETDKALVYVDVQDTASCDFQNNIYYGSTDSLIQFYWPLNSHLTMNEWQQIGKDTLSFFENPFFLSPTDLHIYNLAIADSNAISLPYVMEDIDGDVRDVTHPDIGADEIDMDLSTFHDLDLITIVSPDTNVCLEPDSIILMVANNSIFPIDSFVVNMTLFGQPFASEWIYQQIQPSDTVLVNMGAFHFSPNTLYEWSFSIDNPNGVNDNYYINNYHSTDFIFYDNLEIIVTEISDCDTEVELFIPTFTWETMEWSTGSSENPIEVTTPGTYSVTVTDAQGCVQTATVIIN